MGLRPQFEAGEGGGDTGEISLGRKGGKYTFFFLPWPKTDLGSLDHWQMCVT